jgi:biotin transport system substrate-specific component
MLFGSVIVYAFGVTWLKIITGMNVSKALAAGMIPFLLGDAIKIAAALAITPMLRKTIEASQFSKF